MMTSESMTVPKVAAVSITTNERSCASSHKIMSIELGRVVAISAVLVLHCHPFTGYWKIGDTPWFGYIFDQLTRFAVPLFFLISGYLLQPKLEANPVRALKAYCTPLLKVFLVWSVISLLLPLRWNVVADAGYLAERMGYWGYLSKAPLNSLLEGGLVHLWFIPALIMAVAIGVLLARTNKLAWFIPVGLLLYVYGVLAGSYEVVTDLWSPFVTRNGPFFSTLLFAVGVMIRKYSLAIRSRYAVALLTCGALMHFGEAFWLHQHGQMFNANDYLFGTALWGIGCFFLLLANPNWGNNSLIRSLSPFVLAIFVAHLPMMLVMKNIFGLSGFSGLSADLFVIVSTAVVTLLLIKAIEEAGLARWLFR